MCAAMVGLQFHIYQLLNQRPNGWCNFTDSDQILHLKMHITPNPLPSSCRTSISRYNRYRNENNIMIPVFNLYKCVHVLQKPSLSSRLQWVSDWTMLGSDLVQINVELAGSSQLDSMKASKQPLHSL